MKNAQLNVKDTMTKGGLQEWEYVTDTKQW